MIKRGMMMMMVNDYLKHTGKALAAMKQSIDKCDAMRAASASATLDSSDSAKFPHDLPSKWHAFIEFQPDERGDFLKKEVGGVDDDDDELGPEEEHAWDSTNQDERSERKQRTQQKQSRSRAMSKQLQVGKMVLANSGKLVSQKIVETTKTGLASPLLSQQLQDIKSAITKAVSLLKRFLDRVFAHVFQSELSTLVVLSGSLVLMGLYISLHLSQLRQSWEAIAALQCLNTAEFERILELMQRSHDSTAAQQRLGLDTL